MPRSLYSLGTFCTSADGTRLPLSRISLQSPGGPAPNGAPPVSDNRGGCRVSVPIKCFRVRPRGISELLLAESHPHLRFATPGSPIFDHFESWWRPADDCLRYFERQSAAPVVHSRLGLPDHASA